MVTKLLFFEKSVLGFQNWTKINVQKSKPKTLFPTDFLPFLYILSLKVLKEKVRQIGRPNCAGFLGGHLCRHTLPANIAFESVTIMVRQVY
jgi:hypothetical protein